MLSKSLLILLFCLSACTGGNPVPETVGNDAKQPTGSTIPENKGTGDGGGGGIERSTPEQIKAAIEKTRMVLAEKGLVDERFGWVYRVNITEDEELLLKSIFWGEKKVLEYEIGGKCTNYFDVDGEVDKVRCHAMEDEELPQLVDRVIKYSSKFLTPLNSYILNVPIKFKEKGPCDASTNDHADASVSVNSMEAEVCFSLDYLTRISPNVLEQKIAALWMHEIVHMNGHGEELAYEVDELAERLYYEMYVRKYYTGSFSDEVFNIERNYLNVVEHLSLAKDAVELGDGYEQGLVRDFDREMAYAAFYLGSAESSVSNALEVVDMDTNHLLCPPPYNLVNRSALSSHLKHLYDIGLQLREPVLKKSKNLMSEQDTALLKNALGVSHTILQYCVDPEGVPMRDPKDPFAIYPWKLPEI